MRVALLLFHAASVAAPATASAQQAPAIDYDSYMQGNFQHRIPIFNQTTPEKRAELVSTHLERWLTANRARLSSEQIAAMEENLAFVTPAISAAVIA